MGPAGKAASLGLKHVGSVCHANSIGPRRRWGSGYRVRRVRRIRGNAGIAFGRSAPHCGCAGRRCRLPQRRRLRNAAACRAGLWRPAGLAGLLCSAHRSRGACVGAWPYGDDDRPGRRRLHLPHRAQPRRLLRDFQCSARSAPGSGAWGPVPAAASRWREWSDPVIFEDVPREQHGLERMRGFTQCRCRLHGQVSAT